VLTSKKNQHVVGEVGGVLAPRGGESEARREGPLTKRGFPGPSVSGGMTGFMTSFRTLSNVRPARESGPGNEAREERSPQIIKMDNKRLQGGAIEEKN